MEDKNSIAGRLVSLVIETFVRKFVLIIFRFKFLSLIPICLKGLHFLENILHGFALNHKIYRATKLFLNNII